MCRIKFGLMAAIGVFHSAAVLFAQASDPPPIFDPPKSYYLALGDSITYGYQTFKAKASLPPSGFNTGYVDVFGERLRGIRPGMVTVNYGCPGESTESFVTGPCPWTAFGRQLHDEFSGSQLQAALAFLRAHRGDVSPVTFTLWGNDLPLLLGPCTVNGQLDPACIRITAPAFIAGVAGRISGILQELRSVAPQAEIIVIGAWDSYIDVLAFADPLFQELNAAIEHVAAANRARFADPFKIFNPQGDLTAETQAICRFTLLCVSADSHPSDDGYRAMADLVFEASQYSRLEDK